MKEAVLTPENADDPLIGDDAGDIEEARRPIWIPRPHFVLGLAVLLSLPSMLDFVQGTVDVATMLIRFLTALVVSWLGLIIVGNVINAYLPSQPLEVRPHALGEGDDLSNLVGYDVTGEGITGEAPSESFGLAGEESPEAQGD